MAYIGDKWRLGPVALGFPTARSARRTGKERSPDWRANGITAYTRRDTGKIQAEESNRTCRRCDPPGTTPPAGDGRECEGLHNPWNQVLPDTQNPPQAISGTPASATATPQTFIFTGRDPDGNADIAYMFFLVNTSSTVGANVCHGMYVRASNSIWLLDDAGTGFLGPLTPGSGGTLQNSQCVVYGSTLSVSASGTDMVMNVGMGLQGTYITRAEKVYLWVKDNENHDTGWVQTGTWSSH